MRIALTRTLVSLFWLATAIYALLSAIPFASQQFLKPQLMPALTAFAAWHQWLSIAALGIAATGLAPWLRVKNPAVCAFVGSWAVVSLLALATRGLAGLEPSTIAIVLSLAALVPPVWLALLDLPEPGTDSRPTPADAGAPADFFACAAAALIVSTTHAGVTLLVGAIPTAQWSIELGRSAMLHLVVFLAIFALISVIRGAARRARRHEAVEAWLARGVLAAILGLFVHRIVLSALSFTGATALVVAAAFGAALAIVIGPRGTRAPAGVEAVLSGLVPSWATSSPALAGLWLVLAMSAVAFAETAFSGFDWNFTVAKLIAFCSWLVALATTLRVARSWAQPPAAPRPVRTLAPFAACVLVLGVQQFACTGPSAGSEPGAAAQARRDASSRLIVDALTPSAPTESGLYEYLQRNTNIPHSVHVDPVSVDFAPLARPSAYRPHIFLFVVDSLRRDYLSPYNAAVSFTPSIGRFAADSTVFQRAFTRYGATGLSVPSIWVGGLVLHTQYVTPFAPMNTLAKLLAAEEYAQWISMGHIGEIIVPAIAALEPLDADLPVKDHRLCSTLLEVRGRLDRLTASNRRAFVYSLPQDIHISAIAREGSTPVDALDYSGFNASYASRVRRMDACFGEFVDDLKARGLYDESIIILTADHGDSLGEEGRMGHAYTIFPEVIQVPLLMHLPVALRSTFSATPSAMAFTSDITPSLYALLGHAPARPSVIFGQPLFHTASSAPAVRQAAEVVASSYGSVYGALLDDARRLYIIDAVSLREHVYELDASAGGRAVPVRQEDREAGQRAVRATIDEIARFYAYHPARSK